MRKTWALIRLARPIFLIGGATLYALGVAIAVRQGVPLRLDLALYGQVMVTLVQQTTHFVNEYYDRAGDALNANRTFFSGGSGVLASGEVKHAIARRIMLVLGAASLGTVAVVAFHSPLAGILGAASLLGAWFYSAPPLTLMGSGWGELDASLIVALLTTLTGYALQAQQLDPAVIVVCLPLILLHMAMLLAFEFPDWEADTAIGKRTLAVRLGRTGAGWLHNVLILLAFGLIAILAAAGVSWIPVPWLLGAVPLAAWQILSVTWRIRRGWTHLPLLTLGAVGLFALASALWLVGIITA